MNAYSFEDKLPLSRFIGSSPKLARPFCTLAKKFCKAHMLVDERIDLEHVDQNGCVQ